MSCTRRRFISASAGLAVVALAGCGSTAQPTPTVVAATPAEILTAASERLADTASVHFALSVAGDTFIDSSQTIRLLGAEGDLVRPDRVRTTFQAEVLGKAVSIQLITVGDASWVTNILTGNWEPAPQEFAYRPDILFSTQDGIGPVMGRVKDVTRLDDEAVDGRAAYHLQAQVDQSIVGPLTYYTITGDPVTVDLWIEQSTDNLLRARLSEPDTVDRDDPAVWTLDLSHHGQPVDIKPPTDS